MPNTLISTQTLEDEINEALIQSEETPEEKLNRQQKRMNECGMWSNWFDPHTGQKTGFIFRCDLFRQCPRCLEYRAEKEKGWVSNAVSQHEDNIYVISLSKEDATKLLRNVPKTDYIRYPQENGQDLVFAGEGLFIAHTDRQHVSNEWIYTTDWTEILDTPTGRNKSGTLHVPVAEASKEDFSIINTKQFITNAPRQVVDAAMDKAVADTPHFKPQDAEEVERYLQDRANRAIKQIVRQGYTISDYLKRLKVIHKKISWKNISINTKKPTQEINLLHLKNRPKPICAPL